MSHLGRKGEPATREVLEQSISHRAQVWRFVRDQPQEWVAGKQVQLESGLGDNSTRRVLLKLVRMGWMDSRKGVHNALHYRARMVQAPKTMIMPVSNDELSDSLKRCRKLCGEARRTGLAVTMGKALRETEETLALAIERLREVKPH